MDTSKIDASRRQDWFTDVLTNDPRGCILVAAPSTRQH